MTSEDSGSEKTTGIGEVLADLDGGGVAETLPDDEETDDSPTIERGERTADGVERCPRCDDLFRSLPQHWGGGSGCEYPTPTADEREVLIGIWLAGGFADHSQAGFEGTPRLQIGVNEAVAPPLNDLLGIWHGSMSKLNDDTGTGTFSTRYTPFVAELKQRDRKDAVLSSRAARAMFLARGAVDDGRVALRVRDTDAVQPVVADAGFDATAICDDGVDLIFVPGGDEFIEFIGGPVDESVPLARLHR